MTLDTPAEWLPSYALVPMFTTVECAKIIQRFPSRVLQPAKRISDEDPQKLVVDTDYRQALTGKCEAGDPVYELILARVLERLPQINAAFNFDLYEEPSRLLPMVIINRYDTGEVPGHHAWHVDTGGHSVAQERKLSIVVGLSVTDSYSGGELRILDGDVLFPLMNVTEGIGAVFHSLSLHQVTPMLSGTRYSCVLWLMGPRFR